MRLNTETLPVPTSDHFFFFRCLLRISLFVVVSSVDREELGVSESPSSFLCVATTLHTPNQGFLVDSPEMPRAFIFSTDFLLAPLASHTQDLS